MDSVRTVRVKAALGAIDSFSNNIDLLYATGKDNVDENAVDELVQAIIAEAMHIRQINGRLDEALDESKESSGL